MSFQIIYYFSIACPTVEKTLEMVDKYVARGVNSIQIDMPSRDPFGESDFVKKRMADALRQDDNYSYYMDAIREIRKKHPDLQISVVVYPDVIEAIGLDRYVAFLKEIDAKNNMIAGDMPEAVAAFEQNGITLFGGISYNDPEEGIERYRGVGPEKLVCMRTKRKTDPLNRNYHSWKDRVKLLRDSGIQVTLYAVAEIESKEQLQERKDAGMQGAIIGNILMRLWDEEEKLWALLDEFQSVAE